MRPTILAVVAIACSGIAAGQTAIIPAGTTLQVRLRATISSFGSKPDTPIAALVIAPVETEGRVALPLRSELFGTLTEVRRVGLGLSRETARLHLEFDTLRVPGCEPQTIHGHIVSVDDSREKVDAEGHIVGIRATASPSSLFSGLAVSAASLDPMLLGFALSSSLSVFRIPESEITFRAGTELRYRLDEPLTIRGSFPSQLSEITQSVGEKAALLDLIRQLPFRTVTADASTPSDLTSILYLGSGEGIERAFLAAGWVPADKADKRSDYGALRAVVENQGYREAPMSTLLLDGVQPKFAFAKTLDTFFRRHHLRIYPQKTMWQGLPVWTSTATHDSGIAISRRARSLIHVIDEQIDEERAKVLHDLTLTGCVDGIELIDRPWVPLDARNATGDALRTDGRIAVVRVNRCLSPERADAEDTGDRHTRTRQAAPLRPLRNTMLTLRNDFARGNIVYQSYSGVRLVRDILRRSRTHEPGLHSFHYCGEEFQVVRGAESPRAPKESVVQRKERSLATLLDFSFSAGYSTFGNSRFTTQPIDLQLRDSNGMLTPVFHTIWESEFRQGWSVAPRITLNTWRYVSSEFSYSFNRTALAISTVDPENGMWVYNRFSAQIRQFSYNALLHVRPNGARIRPYLAVGPALQIIRTVGAREQESRLLRFSVKDLGLIVGAYEFGTRPPLEGGGIFQIGLQYGGGVKFQLSPRWFLRGDFRETLSRQPDIWTGSYSTLRQLSDVPSATVVLSPLTLGKHGMLRHQLASIGFGFSF